MNSRLLLVLGLTLYLEFDIFPNCHGLATDSDIRQSKFSSGKKTISNKFSKFNASDKRYVSTTTMINQKKKWNIGRVTSKQHGIVTVLMPKTKLFIDIDYSNLTCKATTTETTPKFQEHATSIAKGLKQKTLFKSIRNKSQSSTPSYIEFYYLDLSDDRIKRKHSNKSSRKFKNESKSNIGRNNIRKSSLASLFKIHVNTVRRKYSVIASLASKSANNIRKGNIGRTKPSKSKLKNIQQTIKRNSKNRNGQNQISKLPRKQVEYKPKDTKEETVIVSVNNLLSTTTYATAYDKVKFFEMYDNYTPKWHNYDPNNKTNLINDYDTHDKNFHIDGQILFDRENEYIYSQQNINKTKFVKKHSMRNIKNEDISLSHLIKQDLLNTSERPVVSKKVFQNFHKKSNSFKAVLSDFPFVAVYIYEPLQVRCDAAGISPHWLLAAGSCLARHRRELRGGALSAFVTFCSEDWRYPQMISYVKRTIIHPHFRPNDKLRRYLFNAGLVQVVNSLDSCNGWAPVTLISHHFTADQQGTTGTAVGWGLDRYDDKYSVTEISRHPLMKYEDTVYSQSCPGNTEYSNAHSPDEDGFKNVYCLSLPPYLSEENDTVHGALLLIGGKLLALYLQEERRPWGEQSAQYTGLWRLLPWLAETAREPDDTFPIEL